jgi:Ca2+-binding RTX toxin-like protein
MQMSAVGQLTGGYSMDAAVVSGAAMLQGNSYTVSNALTLVIEGAGGVGQDVVMTNVSYALVAGSEIEVLRTTNDHGTSSINLTGNDFSQTIVGNNGANIIEGKGGADVMSGGGGNDTFILSATALLGSGNIDTITDYGKGDLVDIRQILDVAAGTNVITGGYLRVTSSGLVQVDLDGGGDHWETLSTINGNSAVNVRYLSGGAATTVSVSRVTDASAQNLVAADETAVDLLGAHQAHDSLLLI